ncbi:DUF1826 domain-containing protein [Mesorhizobium sp. BHbsci]
MTKLEMGESDAIRKSHAHYLKARTIISYLGRKTQPTRAASAEEAGSSGRPPIKQVAIGSIAMFKGRIWQEKPSILHRSRAIDATCERLVLGIDPACGEQELAIMIRATSA